RAPPRARPTTGQSPARSPMRARQHLHFGDQVPEMLGMQAPLAALLHEYAVGRLHRRFGEHGVDMLPPRFRERAHVGGDTGIDEGLVDRIRCEHLTRVPPELVDSGL